MIEEAVSYVCEQYGYSPRDFFGKSFQQGGLTRDELLFLHTKARQREGERFKLIGRFLGAKFKEPLSEPKQPSPGEKPEFIPFGDPAEYSKLSKEERHKLTNAMVASHRRAQADGKFGG